MINCVTTMNKEYYDQVGKLMIKTWCKYFPLDAKLHLYLEDFDLNFSDPRFIIENWDNEIQSNLDLWKTHWQSCKENKSRSLKFTKKALAQIAAWNKLQTEKFLWLDADLIFLDYFNEEMFDKLIDHHVLASWGNGAFESGTVFINLNHPEWLKIKKVYEGIYSGVIPFPHGENPNTDRFLSGNRRLLYPTGWLDGAILGYACSVSNANYRNLNSLCNNKLSNTPLNDSPVGKLMHHLKAKRKNHIDDFLKKHKRLDLAE